MPTNILRKRNTPVRTGAEGPLRAARRCVLIKAGRTEIRAELLATATADRIWSALPLHGTAEKWGRSILFEVPIETGRDRTARTLAEVGDIFFWVEDDRVVIPFGATPISRPGEIRLPRPCNVWAKAMDDVALLKEVASGEKVSLTAA